jgi:HSP20 family molecular chaperone IbpA
MTSKEKKDLVVSQKKEIESASGEPTHAGLMYIPDVDIIEDPVAITLLADLPGTTKENVEININEGVLHLTATVEPPDEKYNVVYGEYELGGYSRKFNLSDKIDQEKISANFKNGVLTLTLPKAAELQPRKVTIS